MISNKEKSTTYVSQELKRDSCSLSHPPARYWKSRHELSHLQPSGEWNFKVFETGGLIILQGFKTVFIMRKRILTFLIISSFSILLLIKTLCATGFSFLFHFLLLFTFQLAMSFIYFRAEKHRDSFLILAMTRMGNNQFYPKGEYNC